MEEMWQFRRLFTRNFTAVLTFVSIIMLTVMTIYAGNKVVIVEDSTAESEGIAEQESVVSGKKWKYSMDSTDNDATSVIIPVPENITEALYEISTRYDKNEVRISFKTVSDQFFHTNPPFGNFEGVKELYGEFDGENVYITFELEKASFCDAQFENIIHGSQLNIAFTPTDAEDRIIVLIDPSHGGSSQGTQVGELAEKDILLKMAKAVCNKSEGKNYRVVLMRDTDTYVNTEKKIELIKIIKPDYFVGLELSLDIEDVKKFGMYASYNGRYYRQGLQNVSFADSILKSVCKATTNRAIGLNEAADEDVILMTMDVPGMVLYAGFMSNEEECALLSNDNYLDKIASGIIDAIDGIVE